MSNHPYLHHREYQRGHRRVGEILKGHPEGATKHADGGAFSRVTSKTAAEHHDAKVSGKKGPKRFARGGKVKHGHTNIAIVLPHGAGAGAASPAPTAGPPVPMGGPAPSPMMPPPGGPPGMPMRARGGKVIDGEATASDIKAWGKRAAKNSYFRGGAASGVGREEKAAHMKRKGK